MLLSRHTRRRDLIALIGGAALVWPRRAPAQQPSLPVIGFLSVGSVDRFQPGVAAFRQGLGEQGYVEGQNVAIDFRWAGGDYDRLPALAVDLVSRRVAVIFAAGGSPTVFAAKAATATIPIVFILGSDPVKSGLVASLNRPGGNVTGVAFLTAELVAKQVELLRLLAPGAALIGVVVDPANGPNAAQNVQAVQDAVQLSGQRIQVLNAATAGEIDAVFASLRGLGVGAVLVTGEPFFRIQRDQLVALAARQAVPALYFDRDFVAAGGLASYGAGLAGAYHQVLRGAKPADLPVMQAATFELTINLKTAKALGLAIPPALLARADEVIE
jgi:putative ABC transport system substrate-binding protein